MLLEGDRQNNYIQNNNKPPCSPVGDLCLLFRGVKTQFLVQVAANLFSPSPFILSLFPEELFPHLHHPPDNGNHGNAMETASVPLGEKVTVATWVSP